ncbi:hypothetical protein BCR36DRAFT_406368 [Piromyces finnis]|uniref:G-protein coupled receptors family 3 profile domain-containing protein n=1 Tax=Piromyces finnis TaxID=1754191 RepID=A0A1Y1V2H8_9FUNG|nr:hypothetical protein BCR36DRAFT_406368 [Piromyces finnis]|eukprot:ORX44513.1 hypothetical protein BCR36DRAFT_406368 [Piromyces finnis]
MNTIFNIYSFLTIFFFLIFRCFSEEINIQILVEKPDFINKEYWKTYSSSIENYLKSNINEKAFKDINLSFSYNLNESVGKAEERDYKNDVKYIIEQLKSSTYDMMILDDKFLFSDNSFVESSYIKNTFNVRKIYQFYYDMTKDINKNDVLFNDPKVLKDGYYNEKLYGLPYELDFDLLYYKDHENTNHQNFEKFSWKNLLNWNDEPNKKTPLGLAFGYDDELLNIFAEYTYSNYNFLEEKDTNFEIFYNDTSKELFHSFKEFVSKSSSLPMEKLLNTTIENAYNSFVGDESIFFKGKASHYKSLVQRNKVFNNEKISALLPPNNYSVLIKKYVIINKNIALQLTSKKMQLYKAKQFGSIPTFNIAQRHRDYSIESYFQNNAILGNFLEKMNRIYIKDIFKSRYAAPFMETRLFLPQDLRNYLIQDDLPSIINVFENIKNLVMKRSDHKEISFLFLYIPMIVFTFVSFLVMHLVYKYRKHPNLKVFSPHFCNLVIFGYVMDIILTPYFMIQDNSIFKCQVQYIYETVVTILILLPLVAITFRIYSIYNNKSKLINGNKLDNQHLFIYILLFLSIMTITVTGITLFFLKFYIISYGNIDTYRLATCDYDGGNGYELIERLIYTILFFIMFIMIIKTGKISKHYGQFNYIYVLIFTFMVERIMDTLLDKLPSNRYFLYYVLLIIFYMISNTLCIYILVGNKLIHIFKHPIPSDSYDELKSENDYSTNIDSYQRSTMEMEIVEDDSTKSNKTILIG